MVAPMFGTVLIANRGEIALRVARTCRELGIRVVTVHSSEDRESAAARISDLVVQIGPGAPKRSYLNAGAIIQAACQTGADAIHPGYGFLSEDPDFAEACECSGITFIGPDAKTMARLGDKSSARSIMAEQGMTLLPGTRGFVADLADAERAAAEIGCPLIIKAVAGGGGRGMRTVHEPREFTKAFVTTVAEARAVFGDPRVYIERYLGSARHVEVQVLIDHHGNGVHLGVRDCSVQRRHQKLVEETPVPGLDPEIAQRMADQAVRAAVDIGFHGVGTFEFLLDDSGNYYFMEVNCRIQVEHPVTEMVTGVDLVREQLLVACGRPLNITQDDVRPYGVSLECRINAEDPYQGFTPTPGLLTDFNPPGGPFTRVDTHAFPGYKIPSSYDSLLAKLVVWAPNREQTIARMRRALREFRASGPGVHTTIPFLVEVLDSPAFEAGSHDLGLIDSLIAAREARVG